LPRIPRRLVALGGLLAVTLALCAVALAKGWLHADTLQRVVASAGPAAWAAYVGAVVLMQLLWAPRVWGLLAAGALFGPLLGAVLSFVADLLVAVVSYFIARGAGQAWVDELLRHRPRAQHAVELLARRRGAWTVGLLRNVPVAHYTLTSYAAGLVGVAPGAFVLGTAVGIVPGAVIYPLLGDAALEPTSPTFIIMAIALGVALIGVMFVARRVLLDATRRGDAPGAGKGSGGSGARL